MKTALFFGGNSTEHEISVLSALQLMKYFKEEDLTMVYVSKENRFYIGEVLKNFEFYKNVCLNMCSEVFLEKKNHDIFLRRKNPFHKKIQIELAFPLMHGTSGEDGSIQGLFELLNLPYVGSSLSTCAILMDKDLTRKMFRVFEIPHNIGKTLYRQEILCDLSVLENIEIEKPWILKPAKGGSSIGISCVDENTMAQRSVCEAFAFDSKLILEKKLENYREFNVAVLGDENEQLISNIEEVHTECDFYSYSDKYGGSIVKQKPATRTCPALIEEALKEEIIMLARKAFLDFECSGVVRFDFLYKDDLVMNEINAIPGSCSMYLYKNICTPYQLIEILEKCALNKHLKKMKEIRQIDSFVFRESWEGILKK